MSLIQSVRENNLNGVQLLIKDGANVNAVDEFGCTALRYAADMGLVECATALIDAKADVDKVDILGASPLVGACGNGHPECVRVLIKHKANVNASSNTYRYSPMHFASLRGHVACIQVRLPPPLFVTLY